jgi:hypothetical protein
MPPSPAATEHQVDLESLLGETMIQYQAGDRITLAWWVPEEFWKAAFVTEELMDPQGMEDFLGVVRPYVVVGALESTLGPTGPDSYVDAETLRASAVLRDSSGVEYAPLDAEAIGQDAILLAAVMKPAVEDLLGPVGEHMEFLYFPAASAEGAPIADARRRGAFSIAVGDSTFEWVLPLDSVLPRKKCLVDGREMRGDWIYCPYHGIRLVEE